MQDSIKLSQGNGGVEGNLLVKDIFYKAFENDILLKSEDSAIIESGKLAFTTDSFTVSPLFFNGGDIGKLAICGSCNDLAMMCAKPKYLTCSFIIEEGFSIDTLNKIIDSMRDELKINKALIVAGDTKIMPKNSIDKIIINTTAIGEVKQRGISSNSINRDDLILLSRDIGSHGATIFIAREGIEMSSTLSSDAASLYPIVEKLINANINITALRDATRGGVASVLNEWAIQSNISIEVDADKISVSDEVFGVCEILGFDATSLANEGTFLLAVKKYDALRALDILKNYNKNAEIIGRVNDAYPKKVVLNSSFGTSRFLEMPQGELLPRIC